MDPNQAYFLMMSAFNPFFQAQVQCLSQKPLPENKKYHRTWNKAQTEEVYSAVTKYSQFQGKKIEDLTLKDFEVIASNFEQSAEQIMVKVNEINKSGTLRPGVWSVEEDEILSTSLKEQKKWGHIANLLNKKVHKGLKVRSGKQCKERWNNYLNPDINRGSWTEAEDILLLEKYKELGNKWSLISRFLDNRTESSVKNRIKSMVNKIKQDLKIKDDLMRGIDLVIDKKKRTVIKKQNKGMEEMDD